MAIKFSQFNLRTDHTEGMYLVGYDGNQNIHITVDNLFDDFINGTENTIAMFGTDGTELADSILSQDAGATILTVAGQLNVDAAATFDTSITVTGDSTLNGNVILGNASTDLITQTGTLYLNGPVKDTTDTLGTVDQVLLSDATGELTFTDLADLHVGGAEVVEVPVKNVQGSALVKGDPVYISGSVGASGRLEVQLADASNTLKMPAVGLLKQDLADQAEGFAVVTGKLRNLITDPIDGVTPTENDVIYVKPSGTSGAALTTTKPVYGNFIQNIGKVGRVSTAADGNFVVSSILRTNDIPNLTPGRLWIGSTGNTIESQTLFVDEASSEVGIGTTDPYAELHIKNTVDNPGLMIESEQATGGNFQNSYINLRAAQTSNNTLANATITLHGVNSVNSAGAKTLVIRNQTLGGGDVLISALDSSSSATNPARFKSSGQVQFEEYGSGSFTGTIAKNLSIDSSGNIIETDPAVDGSGTLNYVPKWTPDSNTLGDSIIFDNGTQVGIGTESVSTFKLTVAGGVKIDGNNLNITNVIPAIYLNSSNSNPDWSLNNQGGEFSIRNNTLSQKRLTISSTGQVGFTLYGQNTFTGTAAKNLSVTSSGAIIETDAVPANIVETITTTDGTYINLTPNTATDGAVTVTADLSAVDGTAATNERYLTKNNTWAEVASIPGTYDWDISDGTNSETIASGDTVTFSGDTYITTSYAAGTNTLTIDHDDTSRTNTTSTSNPGYANTFAAVSNIVTNATGHVTGVNVVTVTMPSEENYYFTASADTGGRVIEKADTLDIVGGTYMSTALTAPLNSPITVTVNHDATTRTDTTSTAAPAYGATFTAIDSLSTNATGHVTSINTKTVTMPSAENYTWTLSADTGTPQSIISGDTVDIEGGTNISTTVGITADTVKIDLDDDVTLAGELTVNGTGQSSFAGQVTIPQVPSANTDAASKHYVDQAVTGALSYQGGYDAANNVPDLDSSPSSNIKKGWTYTVTSDGLFFTEQVRVGDVIIAENDAPTALAEWTTVQNNIDLADASTVGIGNVAAGTNIGVTYSNGTATISNAITNNNQLTNGAGYITDGNTGWNNIYGFITASSSDTLTNKSGDISQWTNDSGYITSASLPTVNNGTLTLSTSAGLDGSATFTANQSGNSTFTVSLDLSELTDMTGAIDPSVDEIILLDNGAERRKRFAEIFGSNAYNSTTIPTNNNQLTNGAGYITSASLPTVNNGTLTMTTTAGLDGSATFTANQSGGSTFSVSLDLSELTDMTGDVSGANDELILLDSGAERRKRIGEIKLGQFNNDQGWTSNVGDITAVTAGNALTGGGTSGSVTINLSTEGPGAGTYGSTSNGTKIDNITIDAYGRIQGITTGSTGSMSSWTIKEGNGTESTSVSNGETLTIAQGTGIQSEMTSTSSGGTITITNTSPNVSTNLSTSTTVSSVTINSSDGTNATINEATSFVAGVMSRAHHDKLDGIAAGATNVTNNNQLTNGAGYITNSVSATSTALSLTSSQGVGLIVQAGNNNQDIANFKSHGGTEEISITSNGYLACQRTNADYPIDVTGDIRASSKIRINNYGAFLSVYYSYLTTNSELWVGYGGGSYARCRASAFTVSSDYRLKENLETLENPIERLKELKVYKFNWKDKPDEDKVDGFIAHEVAEVVPEAIMGEKDGINEYGDPDYQGIDHGKLVPLLTSSLQKAIAKIEELEARVAALES